MKHLKSITKKPALAQHSILELKTEFIVAILDFFLTPIGGGDGGTA